MAVTWAVFVMWLRLSQREDHSFLLLGASQLIQILIGVAMKTRIRQFHHIESDQVFKDQAAHL